MGRAGDHHFGRTSQSTQWAHSNSRPWRRKALHQGQRKPMRRKIGPMNRIRHRARNGSAPGAAGWGARPTFTTPEKPRFLETNSTRPVAQI